MEQKHICVLGGGPGGYTAAFLAADLGMKVTLVDANPKPGGVCLHQGCIPSKALLHVANLINETKRAQQWGITFSAPKIDLDSLRRWKDQLISRMGSGLSMLGNKRNVNMVHGRGTFKNSTTLRVDDQEDICFDMAILAVGSSPVIPKEFRLKSSLIMDSSSALGIEDIPQRMLIVGGGYIGLEMGTFYSALGSKITVVEMMEGLLPGVDRDLVHPLHLGLKKEFEGIYLNTKVTELDAGNNSVTVTFQNKAGTKRETFNRVLVCVGRKPNSEGIGLENTSVRTDQYGFIQIDKNQCTADYNILAIGDVVGGAMLAHKASREARIAVENICNGAVQLEALNIPAVVFTDPEVAWAGLTETEAKASGVEVFTASFPWGASGRASTLSRSDGITKLILEPDTERILGVGMVGVGAGELISEGVLAVDMGLTAKDLAGVIHPHPTLSETLMEAAELALGHPVHIFKK